MTASADSASNVVQHLIGLEHERCSAMVRADLARLRELLHPDLIHVHAKGQVDDYDRYFDTGGFKVVYQVLERSGLQVHLLGDCALMTGRQWLVAERKDGSGTVRIDSQVMQLWLQEGGVWRQRAFQTTPLPMPLG